MVFFRSRKNSIFTVIVFGFIIVTFIFWGGQKADHSVGGALTEVNGEEIPMIDFLKQKSQEEKVFGKFTGGGKINESLMQLIERKVAVGLVMRKLLSQKAKEFGIHIGDEEVLEFLQKEKAFFDPKLNKFSPTVYQAVLEANDLKPVDFERGIREELLIDRVRGFLESSITVSDPEVEETFRVEKIEFTLDSAVFESSKLAEAKKLPITEAAIKENFEKFQGEYTSSEQRIAQVAKLDTNRLAEKLSVSAAEIEQYFNTKVKNSKDSPLSAGPQARALHILISDSSEKGAKKARELMKEIHSEVEFRKAAADYSEDFSNSTQGGDLGYFGEKAMVKPFAEAVFGNSSLNKVLGPVKTNFGYHLIWIIDRTPSEVTLKSRSNQIKYLIGQEKARAEIAKIKEELKKSLETRADPTAELKAKGFEISSTKPFGSKSRLQNLPFVVLQEALQTPKDKWQGPSESGNSLYAYKVTDILPPQPLSIQEARPQILKRLESELSEKLVNDLHLKLIEKKMTWDELAKAGAEVKLSKSFKPFQATQIPNFGESEVLMKLVQELRQASPISNPVLHENKWIFFRASNWAEATKPTPADLERIKADLISRKRSLIVEQFTQNLVKTAKIPPTFRSKYNI